MNRMHLGLTAVVSLVVTGGLFAVQDGNGRDPGERTAVTTIVADDANGDEISVTYRTLHFSDKPIARMKEDPEARKAWAQFIPQLLQGSISTDVDLQWRQYNLPAGKYGMSLSMTEDGNWNLVLLRGERPMGRIPLEMKEAAFKHDYLNMNLMSAGPDSFRLGFHYGEMASSVVFQVAPPSEE